jgi:hypothetical protein
MGFTAGNISALSFAGPAHRTTMCDGLLKAANESTNAVKKASNMINEQSTGFDRAVSFLAFKSRHQASQSNISSLIGNSVYNLNNPLSYGDAANLAEIQAYQDALDLCSLGDSIHKFSGSVDTKLTMISKYQSDHLVQNFDENVPQFKWMPRTVDAFKCGVAQVNEEWYLLHHVVMVVHALARCVDWGVADGQPIYSLERLCDTVGVDRRKAAAILNHGSAITLPHVARSPLKARKSVPRAPGKRTSPRCSAQSLSSKKFVKKKSKIPKGKAGASLNTPSPPGANGDVFSPSKSSPAERTVRDEPDPNFPGWNIRSIRRATGVRQNDNYWYNPNHKSIVVRSQKGVKEINQTIEEKNMDFVSACHHLQAEGKLYFQGGKINKLSPSPPKSPPTQL